MTAVLASDLVCAPGPLTPGWIAIEGDRIVDSGSGPPPSRAERVDGILAPGFVDLQVNGHGTVDFSTATTDRLARADLALARAGTTTFLPTVVSHDRARYDDLLPRLEGVGAGIHLEGPFLGGAPGAHDAAHFEMADVAWLEDLITRFPVRVVTLAPEADPDGDATRALASRGVVVALGHSTADYDTARSAADAGARLVTHVFNAMTPMHHRAPGLVGAALDDARLTPTIIADLVHVHPAVLRIALRAASSIALVSDAVAEGSERRRDGVLAGSSTTLAEGVTNVVGLGFPLERAIRMATSLPADAVGLSDRGRLARGARADVLELHSESLAVARVWRSGYEILSRS